MSLSNLLWALIAFTCLEPGMAPSVTQTPPVIYVQEGKAVILNCTYSTGDTNYYLFWYKQLPSGEMIFLIRQDSYSQQNANEDRYSVNFQKASNSISLMISASQLGDSSVYFCALRDGHSEKRDEESCIKTSTNKRSDTYLLQNPTDALTTQRGSGLRPKMSVNGSAEGLNFFTLSKETHSPS
uniref:Ig-like domain-containing protein n=1 Tax=Vombatus ursinus TaxID=29139 RepID=A0A4X2LN69_VOMUR